MKRPTFSEHWYRVGDLRPRLRAGVRVYRQHFRGELWHVLEDPTAAGVSRRWAGSGGGGYSRLSDAAYRFIALLDGRRSVAEAWRIVCADLGDDAPTQPEAVNLLGQLSATNLLQGDMPDDARAVFARAKKRAGRELRGTLSNVLSIRLPLVDPDRFLEAASASLGMVFSWPGLVLWLALTGFGFAQIAARWDAFAAGIGGALAPGNLGWMYLMFTVIKLMHELGHGLACKRFGLRQGSSGAVHTMGVMLVVLMPVPYVDATSAYALRSKWQRIVVGAAGMYVELALAAVAAIVWSRSAEGTLTHALAFNAVLIAGVSTVLFNANPLLKYDGYYMLSDLLEAPNLAQRARDELYHLVKRYAWGLRQSESPASSRGEAVWLAVYGAVSSVYKLVVFTAIVLFVMGKLFFVGLIAGVAMLGAGVVMPVVRLVKYLASSPQIRRVRARAVICSAAFGAAVLGIGGLWPAPDRVRLLGVVESEQAAEVFAPEDGFVERIADDGAAAGRELGPVCVLRNDGLVVERAIASARWKAAEVRRRSAVIDDPAAARIESERVQLLRGQVEELDRRIAGLELRPAMSGRWQCPDSSRLVGSFVKRGQRLGTVIGGVGSVVRAVAPQRVAARLMALGGGIADRPALIRVEGRPDDEVAAVASAPTPSGSVKLGAGAGSLREEVGGTIRMAEGDSAVGGNARAAEPFFEVRVAPRNVVPGEREVRLLQGQRVWVRIDLEPSPLLSQLVRRVRQIFQERFSLTL